MAKKSNTQDDPATLAFSAVEDALKDSVFGGPADSRQPQPLPRSVKLLTRPSTMVNVVSHAQVTT